MENNENKINSGKIALAVAAVIVLAAALIAIVIAGFGGVKSEEPSVTAETVEVVEATIPADGNPDDETAKGSYTASDEEVLAAGDTVVATIDGHTLTNGQLQIYYWMEVQNFLNSYGSYASYIGLDVSQGLDTQLCGMAEIPETWQQFFLASALNTWRNHQVLAAEAEKAGFQMDPAMEAELAGIPAVLEQNALSYGFSSAEELLAFNVGGGTSLEDYLHFMDLYYLGTLYYNEQVEGAKKILEEEDPEESTKYESLVPMFRLMHQLAQLLRRRRYDRGAIDFDFPESKIILDDRGRPVEIKPYERNQATRLIEDFMLMANETIAEDFYWQELPFVYRVHDVPDAEKLQKLATFINNFGYYMKTLGKSGSKVGSEEIHPKEIQKLLDKIAGTPEEPMISRLALRSMKQAKYSVECTGHFGLAYQYYCHFTSPIRRYPDLQIHRIIKEQLRGRLKENRIEHYREILPQVANQSSKAERRADEAERETDKLKKVEYMETHLGEIFEGVVSGVTAWGIFVELPNTVEGMVHVSKLPGDYYYCIPADNGKMRRLGIRRHAQPPTGKL